ncbi:MAG: preprotein translocase subunit SecG [Tissierellia bacterium]|nr:preprotein translocase subunit SecG [Tissierellia bacterium]
MQTFLSIIVLLSSLSLIISVLLQDSKEGGMGAITGGATDTFWGNRGGSPKEAMLRKISTISAIVFMIATVAVAAV